MPTYEYITQNPKKACRRCRERFDVRQAMSDEPLTVCPECGQPVKRVISVCSVSTTQSSKSMLSDKNLKQKGFTKLVNEGGGKFRNVTAD